MTIIALMAIWGQLCSKQEKMHATFDADGAKWKEDTTDDGKWNGNEENIYCVSLFNLMEHDGMLQEYERGWKHYRTGRHHGTCTINCQ